MLKKKKQYYLDQAKQKGFNLPAFHGARIQRGYRLGSILRGLFHWPWAVPYLNRVLEWLVKKRYKTGVNIALDVMDGKQLKRTVGKRDKQAISELASQKSSQVQSGGGQKATKRKAQPSKISSPSGKKAKTSPKQNKPGQNLEYIYIYFFFQNKSK